MNPSRILRFLVLLLLVGAAVWYQRPGFGPGDPPRSAEAERSPAGKPSAQAPLRKGWSDTDPEINLTHVFFGEINRGGKPVGFHSRPGGRDPEGARVKRVKSGPNRAGVYTAEVEIAEPGSRGWQEKFSSFFPDRMDQAEVIEAVLHAYRNRQPGRNQPWEGPSGAGFPVQGYLSSRGGINTAFPVYQR